MKRISLPFFVCILLLGGCAQTKILEDNLLIEGIGFDQIGKNTILGTYGFPDYLSGGGGSEENTVSTPRAVSFQAKGRTANEITNKIDEKASLPVGVGQLRVVLFGKSLAKNGIGNIIQSLLRNPEISENAYLAVGNGSAEHILKGKYKAIYSVPSMYIPKMFKQNIQKENLPTTNIHEFSYHLDDEGSDPVLPLIRKKGKHLVISGLALFDKGHYVSRIAPRDMFVYKRMVEDTKSGEYEIRVPGKGKAVVKQITSMVTYDVKHAKTIPSITIHVREEGMIIDSLNGLNFEKKNAVKLVERTMEKETVRKGKKMAKRFQKLGIDPLGIGDRVKARNREWSQKKWKKVYPKVRINVQADMTISQTGTTS